VKRRLEFRVSSLELRWRGVGRLIGGLMEYLRKTPLKGDKFRGAGQSRQRETRNAERKTA
jgi:hypothetical protein